MSRSTQDMEQVLAVLVENAPVAMAMFDHQMRYLLANRAWIEEFGLKQVKPLLGRSQYEVFPSLHPGWRQVYEKALLGHVIRSEHDALADSQDCRVIYRWEVRPWRRQADASVGGLMITCERFVQPHAAEASAPAEDQEPQAKTTPETSPASTELALPQVFLDEQGTILSMNQAAARMSLSRGVVSGKTTFWDAFATGAAQSAQIRHELTACLHTLASPEAPASVLLQPSSAEDQEPGWPGSPQPMADTPWLITRVEDGTRYTALALPAQMAPAPLARPPANLSAIASAVASIAQPPAALDLSASSGQTIENRRLQDDLARTRQELKSQQEAARAAQDNVKHLQACLDALPCGVLVLDEMGSVQYQNQPLARLLGKPIKPGESIEDWLATACHGQKHREQVATLWREDVWRRQLTRCVSLATTDGLLKELEFQPASLPGGGLLICIQDATEKCRHEEQLRATEAKFRTILQESPTAILLLDKTGSVFEVNHAAEQLFGQPKSELRRHPLRSWLDASSAEAMAATALSSHAVAKTLEVASIVSAENKPPIPASLRLAPVLDSEGQPHSTVCFIQQHPEPKNSPAPNEAPRQTKSGTHQTDLLLKTNVHGRIKELSPRALQLLGLDESQAIGRPLHLHFRPSDATSFYTDLTSLASHPDGPPLEIACISGSGTRQLIQIKAKPLGAGGYDFAIHQVSSVPAKAPTPAQETQDAWTALTASAGNKTAPKIDLSRERLVLTETHHRVKNHLQIISSLLNLEANSISDSTARSALRSSQNRVRAIADLHQHLYQTALGADNSFIVFARGLLDRLRQCYDVPASRVNVQFDIESGPVQQEWLMPLALTLNETLSNCFEHAFPDERRGLVHVALRFLSNNGELQITDDGVGMPTEHSGGLGLKILAVFAEQMRGQLLLGRPATGGTEVLLRFPLTTEA
jgi:PAS domain S-box-containing protein